MDAIKKIQEIDIQNEYPFIKFEKKDAFFGKMRFKIDGEFTDFHDIELNYTCTDDISSINQAEITEYYLRYHSHLLIGSGIKDLKNYRLKKIKDKAYMLSFNYSEVINYMGRTINYPVKFQLALDIK